VGSAGFVRDGGGIARWVDTRDRGEAQADIDTLEAERQIHATRLMLAKNRAALGEPGPVPIYMIEGDLFEIGVKIDTARRRLKALDEADQDAARRQALVAQNQEFEAILGDTARSQSLTLEQIREDRYAQEKRDRAAAERKPTKKELDAIDINGPNRKALLKSREDATDPQVQAKLGHPPIDALDVAAGRAGAIRDAMFAPAPMPVAGESMVLPKPAQRRSLLDTLRSRLGR